MRHVNCVVREWEASGDLGLVPVMYLDWFENREDYAPAYMNKKGEIRIGHDLISHTSKDKGTVENELQALGVELWHSDFYNQRAVSITPADEIFYWDILNTFIDEHRVNGFSELENAPRVPKKGIDEEDREQINYMVEYVAEKLEKSLPRELFSGEDLETVQAGEKECREWLASNKQRMVDWLTYGFYYASKKRYKGFSPFQVWQVLRALDEVSLDCVQDEVDELAEGMKIRISYDMSGNVSTKWLNKKEFFGDF